MAKTCLAVFMVLLMAVSTGCGISGAVNNKEASDVLQIAATEAIAYAVGHNGKYDGMSAAALTEISSDLRWVDGEPGPGQLAVQEAAGDSYVIVYKNMKGEVFSVVRKNNNVTFVSPGGATVQ